MNEENAISSGVYLVEQFNKGNHEDASRGSLHGLRLTLGYVCALAIERQGYHITYWQFLV